MKFSLPIYPIQRRRRDAVRATACQLAESGKRNIRRDKLRMLAIEAAEKSRGAVGICPFILQRSALRQKDYGITNQSLTMKCEISWPALQKSVLRRSKTSPYHHP